MKPNLTVTAIQTQVLRINEDICEFLLESLKESSLKNGDVLAITSKIISLSEGQIISKNDTDKDSLIKKEADYDLGSLGYGSRLTIKHGLMIPSAGIDESNSEIDSYILFPKDPYKSAEKIYCFLTDKFKIKDLGIIITDSRTMPLRLGVTGVALSYYGFQGVKNLVGEKDLFGRPLKMTQVNIVDSLAVAAVLMMGEADESCPLAIIKNAPVRFTGTIDRTELSVSPEKDMYFPLYKNHIQK